MAVCLGIGMTALEHKVPPEIPIALGSSESGFTHAVRDNGAEGPLQVVMKYVDCDSCDTTTAGIIVLKKNISKYGIYTGLCVYAMGNKGVECKNNRYVNMVLSRSRKLEKRWKPLHRKKPSVM